MRIDEKLRKVHDWANQSTLFEKCGKAFDGSQENVLCFVEMFSKTINWQGLKKYYDDNKEAIEKCLKNGSK